MRELKHSVVRFNYLNSRIQTLKQNNYHLYKAIIDLIATQHNAVMLYIGSAGISVARSKDYCFTNTIQKMQKSIRAIMSVSLHLPRTFKRFVPINISYVWVVKTLFVLLLNAHSSANQIQINFAGFFAAAFCWVYMSPRDLNCFWKFCV